MPNETVRCGETSESAVPTYGTTPKLLIHGQYAQGSYQIPLATNETPLVAGVQRGTRALNQAGGVKTRIERDAMTRMPVMRAIDEAHASQVNQYLQEHPNMIKEAVESETNYGTYLASNIHQDKNLLYVGIEMNTADAAGHNIITRASDNLCELIQRMFPGEIVIESPSSNGASDKKPSRYHADPGRGKYARAQVTLSHEILEGVLKTDAEMLMNLQDSKLKRGSAIAESHAQNAHHANIVAAMYIATGQDVANVVEGSHGKTNMNYILGGIQVEVHMPSLIVGTIGGGTTKEYATKHLGWLECAGPGEPPGTHAKKLAEQIAATTLAGEISLLAALGNPGELMKTHISMERKA